MWGGAVGRRNVCEKNSSAKMRRVSNQGANLARARSL